MSRPITRGLFVVLLLLCAPAAQAQQYRVLITNDDGIGSALLAVLKEELEALPGVEVVVSAPDVNQSGASNSSIGSPLVVDRVDRDGRLFGYAVHGRPADAVTFGINHLGAERPFDLVVSGINNGANVGNVAHGSGTVGAAMRAMMLGVPAIAASQANGNMDTRVSARFVARLVERYRDMGPPPGVVLSINVPSGVIKGVAVRGMGESYLGRSPYRVTSEDGNNTTYESRYVTHRATSPGTDTFAYQDGYITVTPLLFDWTATELLDEIRSWDLN